MKAVLLLAIFLPPLVGAAYGGYRVGHDRASPEKSAAASPSADSVVEDIPVVDLPTTFGAQPDQPSVTPALPSTETVVLPTSVAGALNAYRSGAGTILAPKDWTGDALVGANGNRTIEVHPPGGSSDGGEGVSVYFASSGTLNAIAPAGPYNSWVRDHWQDLVGDEPLPTVIPGIIDQTAHVVRYEYESTDGLMKYGAAYSDAQDFDGLGNGSARFEQIEVTLPAAEQNIAQAIVDQFLS